MSLSSSTLNWAAAAIGSSAKVVAVEALRENPGDRGPWLLHVKHRGGVVDAVLKTGPLDRTGVVRPRSTPAMTRSLMATEAAAMTLAEEHRLAASRLLAVDLDGSGAGVLAILSTAVPGRSKVPDLRSLRTFGAAAARLHAITLVPRPDLPLRTRPRQGEDFIAERAHAARERERYRAASNAEQDAMIRDLIAARPHWSAERARRAIEEARTTPLIEAAEERLRQVPTPQGETVFVHDDLCGANTVWTDHQTVSIVDWEGAGAGYPGLDLGNLRLEESLHFGLPAAGEVVEGWKHESGQDPGPLEYWDLVAALNTPADMTNWAPGLPQATERRDRFLRAVLDNLDRASS